MRSVNITNKGQGNITVEDLASFSVDFPYEDLEMISLHGDWGREAHIQRKRIEYGYTGFGSSTGYSSHLHNPFLALVAPSTTESSGEAWGFSLVYSGSFSVDVERGSQGYVRAMLGFNPNQLSWNLGPGETLTSPECVAVSLKDITNNDPILLLTLANSKPSYRSTRQMASAACHGYFTGFTASI